jgi:hypothetical protein
VVLLWLIDTHRPLLTIIPYSILGSVFPILQQLIHRYIRLSGFLRSFSRFGPAECPACSPSAFLTFIPALDHIEFAVLSSPTFGIVRSFDDIGALGLGPSELASLCYATFSVEFRLMALFPAFEAQFLFTASLHPFLGQLVSSGDDI